MYSTIDAQNSYGGDVLVKLDLSNYPTKDTVATKVDVEGLRQSLEALKNTSHQHYISDVKELKAELDSKLNKTDKVSYKAILTDPEKIEYLENVKIDVVDICQTKDNTGYKIYTDKNNGTLNIVDSNNVVIASYNKTHWIINGVDLNKFITETNETLKNHHDALELLISTVNPPTTTQ